MQGPLAKPNPNVVESSGLTSSARRAEPHSNPINTESTNLTRREALLNALKGTLAAAVATPIIVQATPEAPAQAEATFVPENDYPFFGYEPESQS